MASAKSGTNATNPNAAEAGGARPSNAPKSRRAARGAQTQSRREPQMHPEEPVERRAINFIRPGRPRARPAREAVQERSGVREEGKDAAGGRAPPENRRSTRSDRAGRDTWAIPDSVRNRFTQDGRRWYFPDGTRAFRDDGRRLSTPSENAEVIASLIEIAKVRGWESITVRGSERFRQEAWKQGKLAGLEVRGYRANDVERAAMIRALSREAEDARSPERPLNHPPKGEARPGRGRDAKEGENAVRRDEPIVGKLLDHGSDHYGFNPKADSSYFVHIQTPQGKRVIWGLDLKRAIKESLSHAKIGDEVVLQHRGSRPVTVLRREVDATGKLVSENPVGARRNSWSIETAEFLAQRARAAETLRDGTLPPMRVAQKHPELAGTLLEVRAAQLAARNLRDPRDREIFVERVRNALADEVARGEPLRPVQLRASAQRRPSPERRQAPTR